MGFASGQREINLSHKLAQDAANAKRKIKKKKLNQDEYLLKIKCQDILWHIIFLNKKDDKAAEERFQKIFARISQNVENAAMLGERFAIVTHIEDKDFDRESFKKAIDNEQDEKEKNRLSRTLKPEYLNGIMDKIFRICMNAHIKPFIVPDDFKDNDFSFDNNTFFQGNFLMLIQY